MSLCVQGMEVAIVSDLIMSGALAHIDNVHVDWPLFTLSDKVAAYSITAYYILTSYEQSYVAKHRQHTYVYCIYLCIFVCICLQDKLSDNGSEVNLMYDERNDKFR